MKASELILTLPERPSPQREQLLLDAIVAKSYVEPAWAEVHSYSGGHHAILRVACDALAIGEADDFLRITTNHTTAQLIADKLGAALPTSRISDLAFAQAPVRITPCLQKPDANMAMTSRMVAHHKAIEEKRAGRAGLLSTVGKDWVLSNRLVGNASHAANYGWHDRSAPNHKVWQPVGLAHDRWHVDYSQTIRLVHREVIVDGESMTLDSVLQSPDLCGLVSDEGVLRLVRHPGVPVDSVITRGLPSTRDIGILPLIPFVGARHFTRATNRPIDLVVIHSMEAAETKKTAENVAAWFGGANAPQASAHYCIDSDSIVQCVYEEDIAWHAPGANQNGIGLEHAGYASQNPAGWDDAYSRSTLDLSARLAADICRRHSIPVAFVDEAGLQQGARGITTHAAVTNAFRKSTHTDPGKSFPMEAYLQRILSYL